MDKKPQNPWARVLLGSALVLVPPTAGLLADVPADALDPARAVTILATTATSSGAEFTGAPYSDLVFAAESDFEIVLERDHPLAPVFTVGGPTDPSSGSSTV